MKCIINGPIILNRKDLPKLVPFNYTNVIQKIQTSFLCPDPCRFPDLYLCEHKLVPVTDKDKCEIQSAKEIFKYYRLIICNSVKES